MDNGCPKCERVNVWSNDTGHSTTVIELCVDCQIEQADADVVRAMNRLEELKKKKEKENAKRR